MDLQSRKITFIQEFLRLQNVEIISGLEKLLRKKKAEVYEQGVRPISIGQFNEEISQALEDSENDRVIKASELKDKINKWA